MFVLAAAETEHVKYQTANIIRSFIVKYPFANILTEQITILILKLCEFFVAAKYRYTGSSLTLLSHKSQLAHEQLDNTIHIVNNNKRNNESAVSAYNVSRDLLQTVD